jgi:stearoyl-CoA desaturase (delta-9 desaturase)
MSELTAPAVPGVPPVARRRRILRGASIDAAQQRHFWLFDVLPAAAALVAVPLLWHVGLTWTGVVWFAGMWVLNLAGIEIGFHRLFSHGAFTASPGLRRALVVLGSMGAQGPVISWASNHRHHHQHADTPEDTHTPHAGFGFRHAHLMWKWRYPYPSPSHYTPHLLRDPVVRGASRYYVLWIVLGLGVPAVFGGLEGFLTGGVLRLFLGQHATWCINSLCHLVGVRRYRTGDLSTDVAWLALPTMGGSWHNTHHAFPTTCSNQLHWWQLDPCGWIIRACAAVGLAANLTYPTRSSIAAKRLS